MATLLIQSYSPGPRQGILLNPSPAASPAYHPAQLPALIPSNTSLSSSSSSAPGDASDYFSPSHSKSSSPSPGPSHASSATQTARSKPRNGSNHSTVRRIRFAPLPEPRRDEEQIPVFLDDDDSHPLEQHQLTMSSALAAVSLPLAAHADSDLSKRAQPFSPSVPSSPISARRSLPADSLLLDHSLSQSSSDSSEPPPPDAQHLTVSPDVSQDWDVVPTSPLPPISLAFGTPESPRKTRKWKEMLKPLLGRSASGKSPLTRTFSREETASINGEAQRGRSTSFLAVGGSRNSSVSREASLSRDQRASDFGAPLDRWTSEGGVGVALPLSKKKKHMLFGGGSSSGSGGVPLGRRTQSLTSLSSNNKDDKKAPAKARPATASNGGRKQQRMLNGRVYGAKRNNANANANPFANVRTDEPEFVEWGYGGMGSVKNTGQSSIWSRVQAGDDAAGLARQNDEEDDGSGAAWLKRRREKREREARERAEREKAEAEAVAKAEAKMEAEAEGEADGTTVAESEKQSEDTPEAKPDEPAEDREPAAKAEHSADDAPSSSQPQPQPTPGLPSTPSALDTHKAPPPHLEHITQAVKIPAPSPHHRHHHSYSHAGVHGLSVAHVERRDSAETARPSPANSPRKGEFTAAAAVAAAADAQAAPVVVGTPSESETDGDGDGDERESFSSGVSTTSDDAEDDGEEDSPKDAEGGFEEEDEEEDGEAERSRLTARGAGVEKIARHHKEEQGTVGTPAAEASS